MKYLKSYNSLFESKIDKKIQLLQDLAYDLQDEGLQVEIINGSHTHLLRDPRVSMHTGSRYTDDYKKFIIMTVMDPDNKFSTDLFNTDIIDEFKERLKSYGMNPRGMSGGRNFCVFKFDKWSKMTDSSAIGEAIKFSDYKKWSKDANKGFFDEMGEYFKNFPDHDKNFYRIYFDLEVNPDDFKIVIPDEIEDFFDWFGPDGPYHTQMEIIDYQKGICTDKEGRQMRIGKLLNKLGEVELLQTYNKSKENTLKNLSDLQVVISRHPYDVIGMSTDRGWTTCHDLNDKRYGGEHLHNISRYLRRGTLAAYVIRKSDRSIDNPISRGLIQKSFRHLEVDYHVYGTNIPGFTEFLQNWVKEYNKGK